MAAYPPERITEKSLSAAIDVAQVCKFATIIHGDGGDLTTVHAPLTVVDGPAGVTFVGHIVRSNPLYEILKAGSATVRLIFLPTEGYVSPRVYAEKAKSGKVVPTWNYVAAHIDGTLTAVEDSAALLEILNLQTHDYESASGGDWQVSDAPDEYIDAMGKAIVAITFTPKDGMAIEKLSQNKPGDLAPIKDWLATSAAPARSMAYWMDRQSGKS